MPVTGGNLSCAVSIKAESVTLAPQGDAAVNPLASQSAGASTSDQQRLGFGTGPAQADLFCAAAYDIDPASSLVLDLYTGTDLPDVYGHPAPFRKLRHFSVIIAAGGDSSGVRIGNPTSNGNALWFGAVTETWTIRPSGPPFPGGDDSGVTVGTGTRNVRIDNLGAVPVTVVVFAAGTSS